MSKKVLTIDDSKTLRMIVGKYLRPMGVEILEAENGAVGVTRAKEGMPDLILLDYNMPVMDGYQTLETLKKDPDVKHIPVIMLTTETVRETVIKLIKLGLKDYIAKPFSREALLCKVNPILGLFEGEIPPDGGGSAATRGPAAPATPAPSTPAQPQKPFVLAVDDKENVLKLIKEYLGDKYEVHPALNGTAAIHKIQSTKLDWLFLDMDLPDISGVEVYKKVKPHLDQNNVKIIGLALRTLVEEVGVARKLGIREFLFKPFTKADLTTVMDRMISEGASAGGAGQGGFLRALGNARLLDFPDENDPRYQAYANALGADVRKEVTNMADEGVNRLIIKLSLALITDFSGVKKLINLMDHAAKLTIDIRFVAETEKVKDGLRQFSETAKTVTYPSIEAALNT